MYIIRLSKKDDCFEMYSSNIRHTSCDELSVHIENCSNKITTITYDSVEFLVKNKAGYISELIQPSAYTLSMTEKYITFNIQKTELTRILFDYQAFHFINLFIKNKHRAWKNLNEEEKFRWLRSCFYYNRQHKEYNKHITINGLLINSKNDFLCEFSETLIGIGAYFGSDLDGFDDCFDIYKVKGINIMWENYSSCDFKFKDPLIDILKSRKVNILTD